MPTRKNITAADLGIHLHPGKEKELFKWFLASFLFGKPIQQSVAANTYKVLAETHGLDSPDKVCHHSWQQIVNMLGEGHYVRYDESTAERLLKMCHQLKDDYGGKLGKLHEESADREDLRKRLMAFDGIGPKTVQIFLREADGVWPTKAKTKPAVARSRAGKASHAASPHH